MFLAVRVGVSYTSFMLGLTGGELTLVALLVFAVVSARFWPAAGARLAERMSGSGQSPRRTSHSEVRADERREVDLD